ncbi:putative manganese efflux pump MntP [Weizmannia acidilactici]|uniref:Putative manganese efflux pump MntP n=1 Tax=Weizmannia acidilactici TaxID=2607726 RepID=A0A5J4JKK5_9BACI|nr:manganese efflux pump MntP family protein [Weizmannia acidilactici]GER66370.1 putative manganese efflux pump MntP [Weizmannia acidilactici]GER69484.1 putative manganese efflux pump MntP [Weizmannia acidilactici]GER73021.1 putative manganese efflux pump MntP [Weizmannia acidilactici]
MAVIAEVVTLAIMALALGMDAFSVSLGLGMMKPRMRHIFYIGLTVGIFHVIMPFLGIIAGQLLSHTFGMFAQYIGGIMLVVMGLQMIVFIFKKENESMSPSGWGIILFALSVSLDSFSVGLSLGIFGARMAVVMICFGAAATALTWLGLLIGRKFHVWLGAYGEALGGMILIIFGVKLLLSV